MRVFSCCILALLFVTVWHVNADACRPTPGETPPFKVWTDRSEFAASLLGGRDQRKYVSERVRDLPAVLEQSLRSGATVALVRPRSFEVSTLAPTEYESRSLGAVEAERMWREYATEWRFGIYQLEIIRELKGAAPARPQLDSTHRFFALPQATDMMGQGGGRGPCPYFMGLSFHRSYVFSWDASGAIVQIFSLDEDFVQRHFRKTTGALLDEILVASQR